MIRFIKYILIIAVSSLGFLSCTTDNLNLLNGDGTVIISGIVADIQTCKPLQDITISFEARTPKGRIIDTRTSYSSSEGIYTIEASGFSTEIECRLTAHDDDNLFSEHEIIISIPWNGPSFNPTSNRFVVNNCNFFLQKNNDR